MRGTYQCEKLKLIKSRLINAIGVGERVSLAKVAGLHLEQTARPIRIAVDISIWLFQVQASRGGKNPELRTLYFRLLKLLALPVHPLFVYDGRHKPPFKRGKAVSRNSGTLPIIQRSRDLIERFRFPWHEAPGEAEAECARLQQAGVVDAVISNDVDALMFGSTFTMMNFSNESGTGTSGATHVTCYRVGDKGNVPLSRAGMILFAMLSGGDYIPSGVKGCGPGLSAEIAKAQFGEDLLEILASHAPTLDSDLHGWRERLQYELEVNESGYFATKHPSIQIPEDFPDRTILDYYAEPKVSSKEEMAALRNRLKHAWDREIDPLAIRSFAADNLDWKYRSGARKVIKNLAEPLVSYRLRRQRPVSAISGSSLAPDCDAPWLQKAYKSRVSFGTDGMIELQIDMLPIDVVGIDLMAEEPNPPLPEAEPSSEAAQPGGEDDDAESGADEPQPEPETASKTRVTKRYDIYTVQKIWVLESVAKLGLPAIVKKWEDEQAEKAKKAAAPKKSNTRRTAPKKKGIIDPGMKRGSILKYGTLTKERSELSASQKSYLLESTSTTQQPAVLQTLPSSQVIDVEDDSSMPSMYSQQRASDHMRYSLREVDELIETFSSLTTVSFSRVKRPPMAVQSLTRSQAQAVADCAVEHNNLISSVFESASVQNSSISPAEQLRAPVSISRSSTSEGGGPWKDIEIWPRKSKQNSAHITHRSDMTVHTPDDSFDPDLDQLKKSISSLSISEKRDDGIPSPPTRSLRQPMSLKTKDGTSRQTSQMQPVKEYKPLERDVSLKPHPKLQNVLDIKSPQELHEPKIQPKSDAHPKKSCNVFRAHSKASTEAKLEAAKETQTEGHIENIMTFNGFWTVEASSEAETDLGNFDASQANARSDTKCAESVRKKRLARVSILDMT